MQFFHPSGLIALPAGSEVAYREIAGANELLWRKPEEPIDDSVRSHLPALEDALLRTAERGAIGR